MLNPICRPDERLVYSTRWADEPAEPACRLAIEIIVTNEAREERLEALARRQGLSAFLKVEARSHASL